MEGNIASIFDHSEDQKIPRAFVACCVRGVNKIGEKGENQVILEGCCAIEKIFF